MEKWIEEAAKELVKVMRYAQKYDTHYPDSEEIVGFSAVIERHYKSHLTPNAADCATHMCQHGHYKPACPECHQVPGWPRTAR